MTSAPYGEPLPGGRLAGAVRVGGTVRRPAHPWTPTVQAVLGHLAECGFRGAPKPLGYDDLGRDVQTFMVGETVGESMPWPAWVRSDRALVQVGGWIRRLHDCTASFVPAADARWFTGRSWEPGLVIGHQDASPPNAVWAGDDLVGFVDWDSASPSSRELDLAFTALTWVPLMPAEAGAELGFTGADDRCRRTHLLLDAYGYVADRATFGAAVVRRAMSHASLIRRVAATGDVMFQGVLDMAEKLEMAAREVESLPPEFWRPIQPAGLPRA